MTKFTSPAGGRGMSGRRLKTLPLWALVLAGTFPLHAAETNAPDVVGPRTSRASTTGTEAPGTVAVSFSTGQRCAAAPVPRPVEEVLARAEQHSSGREALLEGIIRTILDGPTDLERVKGYHTALPSGSRLARFEMPTSSSVVLYLDLPEAAMAPEKFSPTRIEEFADQIHMALIPQGISEFTFLVRDPRSGEYRPPFSFVPQPPEIKRGPDPALADTSGTQAKVDTRGTAPGNIGPVTGALSGKAVALNQAHGWLDDTRGADRSIYPNRWRVQRTKIFDTIEDFSCAEFINLYLIPALHNAGAKVHTVREPDLQTNMVIVDNEDATGYAETGTWGTSSAARGFRRPASLPYTGPYTDPFANSSTTRFATVVSGTPTATATFTPNIPAAGFYNVYVTFSASTNRTSGAHVQVHHSGGVTDYRVNQQRDGATWLLLGNFHFQSGSAGKVVVLNDGTDAGNVVIADAVRFGGGMGDVARRTHGVSGRPRWQEEAMNYLQYNGAFADTTLFTNVNSTYVDDGGFTIHYSDEQMGWSNRTRYARWEMTRDNEAGNLVAIGWHTNAAGSGCAGTGTTDSGSGARGTATYRDVDADATADTKNLTTACHNALINGLQKLYNADWRNRGIVASNSYGECSQSNLGTVPGFFFESLFADEEDDNGPWRDPKFRMRAARSLVQGIISYWGGTVFPPETPTNLRVRHIGGGQVRLDWTAGPVRTASIPYGSAAASYLVHRSSNGYGFDNGTAASTTNLTLNAAPGEMIYFRVTAKNAAGVSFPTETLAVRVPAAGQASILVVNGSDRTDQFLARRIAASAVGGCAGSFPNTVRTGDWRTFQSYNYIIQHAGALASAGVGFDSCANECVEAAQVTLGNYQMVDWIGAQEAEADAYDPEDNSAIKLSARTALQNYLQGGGRLFISNSEMAWDFDRSTARPQDQRDFMANYIKARYSSDSANTYQAQGAAGSIFASLGSLTFDNGTGATYDVRFPDVLTPSGGAVSALNYVGGTGGTAAIQYAGNFGTSATPGKLVYLGFGFETITNAATRNTMMSNIINYFALSGVSDWNQYGEAKAPMPSGN